MAFADAEIRAKSEAKIVNAINVYLYISINPIVAYNGLKFFNRLNAKNF